MGSYNVHSSHQRSSTITAVFMDLILSVWISNPSCCFQRFKRLQRISPQLLEATRQMKISSLHLCYNLLICFMKKHQNQTQLFCTDKGWWLFIGMSKRPFADSSQSAALLIMHHLCIFELLLSCNCAHVQQPQLQTSALLGNSRRVSTVIVRSADSESQTKSPFTAIRHMSEQLDAHWLNYNRVWIVSKQHEEECSVLKLSVHLAVVWSEAARRPQNVNKEQNKENESGERAAWAQSGWREWIIQRAQFICEVETRSASVWTFKNRCLLVAPDLIPPTWAVVCDWTEEKLE